MYTDELLRYFGPKYKLLCYIPGEVDLFIVELTVLLLLIFVCNLYDLQLTATLICCDQCCSVQWWTCSNIDTQVINKTWMMADLGSVGEGSSVREAQWGLIGHWWWLSANQSALSRVIGFSEGSLGDGIGEGSPWLNHCCRKAAYCATGGKVNDRKKNQVLHYFWDKND